MIDTYVSVGNRKWHDAVLFLHPSSTDLLDSSATQACVVSGSSTCKYVHDSLQLSQSLKYWQSQGGRYAHVQYIEIEWHVSTSTEMDPCTSTYVL